MLGYIAPIIKIDEKCHYNFALGMLSMVLIYSFGILEIRKNTVEKDQHKLSKTQVCNQDWFYNIQWT